jgi:carboxyl-terminal processing protease
MSDALDCFEVAWKTVNDTYFDPTFGGVDWQAVHDRYRPQIAAAESDELFYRLLNQMLYELEVSHIGALPPRWMLERWFSPRDFGQGSIGVDVRWLEEQAVVTSVTPGEPAKEAGLRAGALLHSIDEVTVREIAEETPLRPPYNARNRRNQVATEIARHLYGPPGTQVSLRTTTQGAEPAIVSVRRVERQGGHPLYEGAPPAYLKVASTRLEDGVGYLYLSAFQWPLADSICQAMDAMRALPALVVDVRGNSGGDFDLFIGKFFDAPASCLCVQTREGRAEITIEPKEDPYRGRVAVLVDEMSISAAELFAASMQTTGRGVVVGDRTPGVALGTRFAQLPNGALFVHPDRQYRMMDGAVLEGRGVVPDVEVSLKGELLLQGIDSQLQAAIRRIKVGAH